MRTNDFLPLSRLRSILSVAFKALHGLAQLTCLATAPHCPGPIHLMLSHFSDSALIISFALKVLSSHFHLGHLQVPQEFTFKRHIFHAASLHPVGNTPSRP